MNLTATQVQDLQLHILMFNDMPKEEWVRKLDTVEKLKMSISIPESAMLPQEYRGAVKTRIKLLEEGANVEEPVQSHRPVDVSMSNRTFVKPQVQQEEQVIERPDFIHTNKGIFKSLDRLAKNLKKLYPTSSNIDLIFKDVLKQMGLSKKVTFLSEPFYTNFIHFAKRKLDDEQIEMLGGEVRESTHQNLCTETMLTETSQECQLSEVVLDEPEKESDKEETESQATGTKTDPVEQFPYEVSDVDGEGPNVTFKNFKDAQGYQKEWNAGLDKDEPKLKARKRK